MENTARCDSLLATLLDEQQFAAHLGGTAPTEGRPQASAEIRPPWPKAATWLGAALEAGPMLLLEMDRAH